MTSLYSESLCVFSSSSFNSENENFRILGKHALSVEMMYMISRFESNAAAVLFGGMG